MSGKADAHTERRLTDISIERGNDVLDSDAKKRCKLGVNGDCRGSKREKEKDENSSF